MSHPAPCVGATAASRVDDRSGEDVTSSPDRESRLEFTDFYVSERTALVRFAYSLTADAQASEDITAETMMVMLKRWDDLVQWVDEVGGHDRLRSFAFGVARNFARDLYRARQRYLLVGVSESLLPTMEEEPSDSGIEMLDVERTIAQLPDKQSQVLRMEMEGFTTAEIAREMRVQESTARTHLASARRHMRERLYELYTSCNA